MGRISFTFLEILGVLALALLVRTGESMSCTSQTFANNMVYSNCIDLPHLSAYLHWTYNPVNSSLSMAFIAPPATPDGWVAWAINPNAIGMIGSQALLALKAKGTVTVKTYGIRSYDFTQSSLNLTYEVWDLSAEDSNGTITIFGKWKLPEKTEKINQTWQVGPGVTPNGWPIGHALLPDNVQAKGILELLTRGGSTAPALQPSASPVLEPAASPAGVPISSPASGPATESMICMSQTFANKMVYSRCTDLPHLGAFLFWTYNASNSSLSMAFVAPLAQPNGWVAWAINPNATGMIGAQALLALKSNGTVIVKTYGIISRILEQSTFNLSYKVWDLSAEESNGSMKIFGKWKLPEKTEQVNQVWQVGPGVNPDGWPMGHLLEPDNLQAEGILVLGGEQTSSTPAPQPASSSTAPRLGVGFSMSLFVILGSLIVF
ncbi:Auxin-induced in root cultures protein 12 [Morella rubra]|uniref:Auxin-induced in root cultures protein 12 n=1 Tax=Morella rubra TaxID=262757 RepID=A0A6A1UWF7_9ROSI|nr:Auxin-induced in root cultures protein 12 [Morella rubra]